MRVTKEQAAQNRRQILDIAGRLFRERGFEGVAVAELMKAVGFTHGGFYNHFPSKDALAAEACAVSLERSNAELAGTLAEAPHKAWNRFLAQYLTRAHRDDPAHGCTLAALAADAARQGKEVQARFAEALEEVVEIIAGHLATAQAKARPKRARGRARERAMRIYCELVGAVVLARAVAGADAALSDEILSTTRRALLREAG
jgi:TetR/AcrR family transcriptional repressor of nem operon